VASKMVYSNTTTTTNIALKTKCKNNEPLKVKK